MRSCLLSADLLVAIVAAAIYFFGSLLPLKPVIKEKTYGSALEGQR